MLFRSGEWHDRLQRMIEENGLQQCACLHEPTSTIGDEYADSSMLAMSSNYEGFPMVMIEAMASGLPVVSFDFQCGPKDIIRDGENGLLVKNGDIEGLAQALMRLMDDEAYRKCLSVNARKVVQTYSEEAVMKQWVSLFTTLASH